MGIGLAQAVKNSTSKLISPVILHDKQKINNEDSRNSHQEGSYEN